MDENQMERDLIELLDEEGNEFVAEVVDYFFYNGDEYATLATVEEEEDREPDRFVMRVNSFTDEDGEEMEEFLPVEEKLEEALIEVARTRLTQDMEQE